MPSNRAAVEATPNIKPEQAVGFVQSEIAIPIPPSGTSKISSTNVFNTLIDTSTWSKWNTFVPKCTIRYQPTSSTTISSNHSEEELSPVLQLGTKFTMHVNTALKLSTTLDESLRLYDEKKLHDIAAVITVFEEPNPTENKPGRIVWAVDVSAKGSFPLWLLRAERTHIVSEETVGQEKVVRVNNWEFQTGWLSWIVKWMFQGMFEEVAFPRWVKDLKEYVEKL